MVVTTTEAVSSQPEALVQMNLYVPGLVNPVMVVNGLAGVVIEAVPGLLLTAVHVPAPVAPITAKPPGSPIQLTVW